MIWIMYSRHATVCTGCIINRSVDILISHMQGMNFYQSYVDILKSSKYELKIRDLATKDFSHKFQH
jgi:hypothetical protein